MTTEYYTIDSDRLHEIAQAAQMTERLARAICLADWTEGREHQEWLDTAPVRAIADWLVAIDVDRQRAP